MYFAKQWDFERFLLLEGGVYTLAFWVGQVIIGGILPLLMIFSPGSARNPALIFVAALLVIVGGHAQMYVTIVGGQAFPLDLFPGFAESSNFFDGVVHHYSPTMWEIMLGLGGMATAFILTTAAVRVLKFLPEDDFKDMQHLDSH
jgi:molybdopterin-containing oxidoreductase family membrane subunit